jgi:hypothetical protein
MLEEIEAYAPAVNSVLNIFKFSLALLPCFCYRNSNKVIATKAQRKKENFRQDVQGV